MRPTRLSQQAVSTLSAYVVELDVFTGPLDLLLHLIEKEDLDITRVALAQVTDQYLAYLGAMPRRDPAELSAFLLVAVKLLWIKSQTLLPRPPAGTGIEEEEEAEDLVRQLQEYRRYKEVARQLQAWREAGRRSFGRVAAPPLPAPRPVELEGATLEALLAALQSRLEELTPQITAHPLAVPHHVTLAEKARQIYTLLEQGEVLFQHLLAQSPTREEVVVTLWAVLELFKRGWITVEQEDLFGPIVIRRRRDADWNGSGEWWTELEDLA